MSELPVTRYNSSMQAPDSEQFQSSLRDVIDWCVTRHRGAVFDSAEATHRRSLSEMVDRLIEEARTAPNASKTEQWKRAQPLLSQIRESLGSLRSRFRSSSLMPTRPVHELRTDSDWLEVVSEVANKRSAQNKQNPLAEDHFVRADSGQLLVYFPHENGTADFSSNGFFDGENVPPWDLWVSLSEGALISRVPIGLIEAAHMGIDVNPEQCIQWLRQ